MKKILKVALALLMMSVCLSVLACVPYSKAATPEQIEASIVKGLEWLAAQQQADGSWPTDYYVRVGYTGMAVLKFETRAVELKKDPLDQSYEYYAQVRNGLDFIFSMAQLVDISVQTHGNPDSNGNGKGVTFNTEGREGETYGTGIASMAIAASTHPEMVVSVVGSPVDGWTYKDVEQDVMDWLAWGQNEESNPGDWWRGGWGYDPNSIGWSDNSNSGYALLGLVYAESPLPHGFGLTVPQFVKDELNIWIDYIQNDINGDDLDGGSGYSGPDGWVNILKTGTLLQEMAFVGDTLATPRVDEAIKYIERHWNDLNGDPGWKWSLPTVHKQAMYTTMKGFTAFNIKLIDTDADGARDDDWFNEFADALLAEQALFPEGHWNTDVWAGDYIMPTCWALLILEKAAPPVAKYDLTVKVVDANTLDPISGAMVTASGPEYQEGFTGLDGKVKFEDILAGGYSVGASKTGYVPASVMVEVSEDTEITIRLMPEGPPQPVGGYEAPPNILTLIAPWIFLGFAISVGTIAVARRKTKY
ncbi:MAG: hypothetical protein QXN36_00350 [Candidatus Bathyarchaeia archaeon]